MKYNPVIHHRKSIRLKEFDYSQGGYYFVTICTQGRVNLFGFIENGKMIMNETGILANKILNDLPLRFKRIDIDTYIFMPNHLHVIIKINEPHHNVGNVGVELALPLALPNDATKKNETVEEDRASSVPTLGRIMQAFKSISTIEINRYRCSTGIPVWQRNYYEHIIRNEKEYFKLRKYIENNPLNWESDENFI